MSWIRSRFCFRYCALFNRLFKFEQLFQTAWHRAGLTSDLPPENTFLSVQLAAGS